jgi:hypothetical protein
MDVPGQHEGDPPVRPHRREARVPLAEVRLAAHVLSVRGHRQEVRRAAGVREVEDAAAVPHREGVHALEGRDLDEIGAARVADPDRVRRAAAVALPGSATARAREGPASARGLDVEVRGPADRELLGVPAGGGNGENLPAAVGMLAPALEQDAVALRRPADDDVGGRVPGQPPRLPALGRDDEGVGVAVVLAGEGDRAPVGREAREGLAARVVRQPPRRAARGGHGPEVGLGDEDEGLAVDVRVAQVAFSGSHRGREQSDKGQRDRDSHVRGKGPSFSP